MKVVFDASVLLLLVDPTAKAPAVDEAVERQGSARDRIDHLIATLDKRRAIAVVPSPALTELLINSGQAAGGVAEILSATRRFIIHPFDMKAAVECGVMLGDARRKGKRSAPWAKVKFDHQIVAIAKSVNAEVIYSDDSDIKKLGDKENIRVFGVWDLAPPPVEAQYDMLLSQPSADAESKPA